MRAKLLHAAIISALKLKVHALATANFQGKVYQLQIVMSSY